MRFIDILFIGITTIVGNKLHSLLTLIGIIIGIASVLAMIAIGNGAKEVIRQDIEKLGGLNVFTLYRTTSKFEMGENSLRAESEQGVL